MPCGSRHEPTPASRPNYPEATICESKEDEWQQEAGHHRYQLAHCKRVEKENWENQLEVLMSFHTLAKCRQAKEGQRSHNSDQFRKANHIVCKMCATLDDHPPSRATRVGQPCSASSIQVGVNLEESAPHRGSTTHIFTTHMGSESY